MYVERERERERASEGKREREREREEERKREREREGGRERGRERERERKRERENLPILQRFAGGGLRDVEPAFVHSRRRVVVCVFGRVLSSPATRCVARWCIGHESTLVLEL
jgi:hypothetical protein